MDLKKYTPSFVGYECAAMVRHRLENIDDNVIELYPLSQWGILADTFCYPISYDIKNADNKELNRVFARKTLRKWIDGRVVDGSSLEN